MLALIACGLMAGLVLGGFLRLEAGGLALAPLALGTLLFLIAARVKSRPRTWTLALASVAAFAGGVALVRPPEAPGHAAAWSIHGTVERCAADGCVLDLDGMGPVSALVVAVHTRARVHGLVASAGDAVTLEAELRPRAAFRNPSPHPDWPSLEPIAWTGRARESTVVVASASAPRAAIESIRERVRAGLERTLTSPTRGLAIALVLGDEIDVDAESAARVRAVGLTHVLAVSGLHVTIVVGAVLFLLRRVLRRAGIASHIDPARVAHGIAAPLALVYAELAGGSPSAWRAAVTAALAWSLRAAGRRPDAIATSALAVIVFAAIDPGSALRPAFVLSIAATAAVLDLPGELTLETLASSSARASIATAPVVLWCFEGVPLVGIVANVLLLPIVAALVLPLATIHALVAAIVPDLAGPTAFALDLTCRGFVGACDALGAIEIGRALPPLDALEGVLATLAAVGFVATRGARPKLVIAAIAIVALAGAEVRLRANEVGTGELRVTFLDVGQGDAAIVDLPDGSLMLVDTGGAFETGADPGARVLVPLLRARRRARIHRLVITHPHPDHYGGVAAIAARFPIDEIWDSGQAPDEDPDGSWSRALASLGAHARVLAPRALCEHPREHAGARIEVLWPCPAFDPGWDANDNSLVLRITFGSRTLLLLGDAEAHAEAALLARGLRGPVDVLKVGHHGSQTSSTEALVDALAPHLAIVSAGVGNRFGHPHEDVVARLSRHHATILRTDQDGGIIVRTDGHALSAHAWSGATYDAP